MLLRVFRKFFPAVAVLIILLVLSGCLHAGLEYRQLDAAGEAFADSSVVLVQISDLHVREKNRIYSEMVNEINSIHPDALLLTGDLVESEQELELLGQYLGLLDPDAAKFAIPGNWDGPPKVDTDRYRAFLSGLGIKLLVNEQVEITAKNRNIIIFGTDDLISGRPDFRAFHPREDALNIVLAHCPVLFDRLHKLFSWYAGPVFMLSGHTHGGQITFFGYPLVGNYGSGSYLSGFYYHDNFTLYVNRGIGTRRVKMRIFADPEITVFRENGNSLSAKESAKKNPEPK